MRFAAALHPEPLGELFCPPDPLVVIRISGRGGREEGKGRP